MKILLFCPILLTLVLVSAVPARHPPAHPPRLLLKEMMTTLNHLEKSLKNVGDTLIADVFDVHKCEREDFCRAGKVLFHVVQRHGKEFREIGKIVRQLKEYNMDFKAQCTVVENNEIELRMLLRHLRLCAQKKYAQEVRPTL